MSHIQWGHGSWSAPFEPTISQLSQCKLKCVHGALSLLFDTPTKYLGTDHTGFLCGKCDGNAHTTSGHLLPSGAKTSLISVCQGCRVPTESVEKKQLVDGDVKGQPVLPSTLPLLSQHHHSLL